MTVRLHLFRHGERDPHGPGLTARGRDQAERLGRRLRGIPFGAIHHGALPRAAETAEIVARHLPGIPRHACEHAADRTPFPSPALRAEYPARYLPWLDTVPVQERDPDAAALRAAVEHFAARTGDELVVTHNFVIGWFVRHVLDAPHWRWIGLNQANCGLTIVEWEPGRPPVLVAFNDTGHLEP
ncbi:histidine phosphatase family protein [Dactylosporangium sp. CA-139066]|uniref:histidine phosphatase family protein n=1 Tax=Dactylosporangium sp. CA-139066 TaxID=3239930 RepID=UPI003D9434C1